jgi:hypothetical protein
MATIPANVTNQIEIHQEDDHNNDDDNTGDTTGQANVLTGEASAAGSTTSFNLRVEQNKIPEFFGSKSKVTFSVMDFVRWLEDLAKTNKWMDAQMYCNFANALQNLAGKWLSSMVDIDNEEPHQHLWSDFKDLFKQAYAVQTNESLILEGLSNLAMKPNETTNKVISRITDMIRVIKESFADFRGKIPEPLNDINEGISDKSFRTFLKRHNAMMFNFFKMNLFKAALTPDLRSVVAQQDQETKTIQKMYQVATTA